jgi:thiol:disulfide interchange protein
MKNKCPRCGIKQDGLAECEICGLKFYEFDDAKEIKTKTSTKSNYYFLPVLILAFGIVSWFYFKPESVKSTVVGKIRWFTDYQQGLSVARETGQPVMLFFSAQWCPTCKSLINSAFSDNRVVKACRKIVPVYVDVDQNPSLSADYQIRYVPTVFLLNSQGQPVAKLVGSSDAGDYIAAIKKISAR